jgi:hypothetical protein
MTFVSPGTNNLDLKVKREIAFNFAVIDVDGNIAPKYLHTILGALPFYLDLINEQK